MFRAKPGRAVVVAVVALAAAGTLAYSAGAAVGAPERKAPKLSHQLCYNATAKGFKIPATVKLYDKLSPKGFKPKIIAAVLHCNPVIKTVTSAGITTVYPITNAAAHLACFTIKQAKQPTPTVSLANQFGSGTLVLAQPTLLCLPSWKSLTGPPKKRQVQPPGLDHFVCYPVTSSHAKFTVPSLTLQDEFDAKPVTPQLVGSTPGLLCLPAKKVIGKAVFEILHPHGSLVCFPVIKTPIKSPVYDQNQFGTAKLTITKVSWLCLPSKITAIG
jgi:hypothetical protein